MACWLDGKTVVVTGASGGMGAGIAATLIKKHGCTVIGVARSEPKMLKFIDELGPTYASQFSYKLFDVSVKENWENFAQELQDNDTKIDILINNAGITRDGLLAMMKEEDFDSVLDTNLKGAFNMIRHMTGLFIRAREGCIINMASVAGIMGNAGQCNYSASKAGLIGLTKSVAKELAPKGIRCNAVAPGFIATDMTGNQTDNPLLNMIPLGKMGETDDVADAVAYLITAKYVTGEVLRIDGGLAM